MIDYIFYGLYVLLFLYAILWDAAYASWIRYKFTRRSFTVTLSGTGLNVRKGDVLKTHRYGINGKVIDIFERENSTQLTVKPIKRKLFTHRKILANKL